MGAGSDSMIAVFQQATSTQTYGPSGLAWAAIAVTIASVAVTLFSSGIRALIGRSKRKIRMYDSSLRIKEVASRYPRLNLGQLGPMQKELVTLALKDLLDSPLLPSLTHSSTKAAMNELLSALKPFEETPDSDERR